VNTHRNAMFYANISSGKAPDIPDSPAASTLPLSIISNSQLLRESLPHLLSSYFQVELIHSYSSEPLMALNGILPRHVFLIDSRIGPDLTLDWTRALHTQRASPFVVVIELSNHIDLIVDCISAGACAYALQGASIKELAETISQLWQGVRSCSPEVTAHLFTRLQMAEQAAVRSMFSDLAEPLTRREREVLDLIAKGYSNKEIAAELVIALHTVKHHVHHILEKLKLQHRNEVAKLAAEKGLPKK
jgi:DNA-binding NarL/FixJ family response regulator